MSKPPFDVPTNDPAGSVLMNARGRSESRLTPTALPVWVTSCSVMWAVPSTVSVLKIWLSSPLLPTVIELSPAPASIVVLAPEGLEVERVGAGARVDRQVQARRDRVDVDRIAAAG